MGFAHIAIGCVFGDGFSINYDVPSSRRKWPLLRGRPLFHDLVIDFPSCLMPIELVNYETGLLRVPGRIRIQRQRTVEIRARDTESELKFLSAFGIWSGKLIRVGSHVKNWRIDLWVHQDDRSPLDPPLDIEGYAAIAFYSTDVEKDEELLLAAGGRMSTGKFGLFLNGRTLEICMLRSPEGTIVELIKVCGGKDENRRPVDDSCKRDDDLSPAVASDRGGNAARTARNRGARDS